MTRDEYAQAIKDGAETIGVNAAMAALIAEVPILSLPVLNTLTKAFLSWLVGKLIQQSEFGLFFNYIDIRTSQQGKDFYNAVTHTQAVRKSGTAEEIEAAQDAQVRAFYNFVSLRS